MSSISNLTSSYLQAMLSNALQGTSSPTNTTGTSTSSVATSSVSQQSDNGQLSPFAQLMSTLQQLQQSNPAQYQQVTQQIATNLQTASQTAQKDGNTTAAAQLSQLSTDFTNASTSGQLPNVQDLANAVGGGVSGHHHHHHSDSSSGDQDSNSSTSSSSSTTSSSSANQTLSQFLSSLQSSSTQADSLNPMSIILNTLASAGITSNNS